MRPRTIAALIALTLTGCSGNDDAPGARIGPRDPFRALSTDPPALGLLYLNSTLKVRFSHDVDLSSVSFNTVRLDVFDGTTGDRLDEMVTGRFRYARDASGADDQKTVELVPTWPSNDTLTDGGWKPARRYELRLGELRDTRGQTLSPDSPVRAMSLLSIAGTTAEELFFDPVKGPPRVAGIDATPVVEGGSGPSGQYRGPGDTVPPHRSGPRNPPRVGLNHPGGVPVEVVVRFDQPLDPRADNVPVRQDPDPRSRERDRGNLYLVYDDPELGRNRWIPAQVELLNANEGAVVILRPEGALPNDAEVKVWVRPHLRDVHGDNHLSAPRWSPIAGSFATATAYGSQFAALVLDFEQAGILDPEAPVRFPLAELEDGVLRASFDAASFESTTADFEPRTSRYLNTDFEVVVPRHGPPIRVAGGVFRFRNVTIPSGVTVFGTGTNPLVFLATGEVRIDGHVSVDGADGAYGSGLSSANVIVPGGRGVCTGGAGGRGSLNRIGTTTRGETGHGPFGREKDGGQGGRVACRGTTNAHFGSGGGGGSFATQGDPDYYDNTDPLATGRGGAGADFAGEVLGGEAGPTAFEDRDGDNDHWGRRVDERGNLVIGELKTPRGGAGGGGGGDRTAGSTADPCDGGATFINDERAGGGGGGAGVVIVQALGRITVGARGRVSADGGRGGGGEDHGSCRQAGGGGGGAGGMVVLMSATGIDLFAHQGTWAAGDTAFSVTADGSLGTNTGFGRPIRLQKYPQASGSPNAGGFGGMGIVQLMTPPGVDADDTGTVQDDNIRVRALNGMVLPGRDKLRYLYRGDLRPDPILLHCPFGRRSAAWTRWLRTGVTSRRPAGARGEGARTIRAPDLPGPEWRFPNTHASGPRAGYLVTDPATGQPPGRVVKLRDGNERAGITEILKISADGKQELRLVLTGNVLPPADRYRGYLARFRDRAGIDLGTARIRDHTESELVFDGCPAGSSAATVEILEHFVEVFSDQGPGLGPTYANGNETVPIANVRIGFAFHADPSRPDLDENEDRNRWPRRLGTLTYDPAGPAIRPLGYEFVRAGILFDLNWNPGDPTLPGPHPATATSARPAARTVVLPLRF